MLLSFVSSSDALCCGSKGLDTERKGKHIDIASKEGGILTGQSVHCFSLEKLLEEVEQHWIG
jgi:hypothetical protein